MEITDPHHEDQVMFGQSGPLGATGAGHVLPCPGISKSRRQATALFAAPEAGDQPFHRVESNDHTAGHVNEMKDTVELSHIKARRRK
jgi:hypothetical protein